MQVFNEPGHWDYFISHTYRSSKAMLLAQDIRADLLERGYSVWLGVKMKYQTREAVKEGVVNSRTVIAIVTGPCLNPGRPQDPPECNAYLNRKLCMQNLLWAIDASITIVPVVDWLDKPNIPTLLSAKGSARFKELFGIGTFKKIVSTLEQQIIISFNRMHSAREKGIKRIIEYHGIRAKRKV